jgi:hypothetical protein
MAVILEKTDSAYFPCFKNLFRNIIGGTVDIITYKVYSL